jgi:hypothetical protein
VNGDFSTDFDDSAIAIQPDNHVFAVENHETDDFVRDLRQEITLRLPGMSKFSWAFERLDYIII